MKEFFISRDEVNKPLSQRGQNVTKSEDYAKFFSETREFAYSIPVDYVPFQLDEIRADQLKGADEIGKAITMAFAKILKQALAYASAGSWNNAQTEMAHEIAHFAVFVRYSVTKRWEETELVPGFYPGKKVVHIVTSAPKIDWEFFGEKFPFKALSPLLTKMMQGLSLDDLRNLPYAKCEALASEFSEIIRAL